MIREYKLDNFGLYRIGKSDIEYEIECLLKEYNPHLLEKPQEIDIEDFVERFLKLNLSYKKLSPNNDLFGMFVFNDGLYDAYDENNNKETIYVKEKSIYIDPSLLEIGEHVFRFTIGHEAGHYIFQYDLVEKPDSIQDSYQTHPGANVSYMTIINGKRILNTRKEWMEWQANYASACILANRTAALKLIAEILGREVTYNSDFLKTVSPFEYMVIKYQFQKVFNMSDTAAGIRIKELSNPHL